MATATGTGWYRDGAEGGTASASRHSASKAPADLHRFLANGSVIEAHPGQRLRVVIKGVGKLAAVTHNIVLLKKGTASKEFADKASTTTEETGSIPPAMSDQVIAASALVKPGESAEIIFEAPLPKGAGKGERSTIGLPWIFRLTHSVQLGKPNLSCGVPLIVRSTR